MTSVDAAVRWLKGERTDEIASALSVDTRPPEAILVEEYERIVHDAGGSFLIELSDLCLKHGVTVQRDERGLYLVSPKHARLEWEEVAKHVQAGRAER